MTEKYQEFLKKLNIVQEEEFNEVIETLPEFNMEAINIDWYGDIEDQQTLAEAIITEIIENNWDAEIDYINWSYKTFELIECGSIEDLKEIADAFTNWTIENYSEIEEELKERDKILPKTCALENLKSILNKIPEEELTNLYEKYAD